MQRIFIRYHYSESDRWLLQNTNELLAESLLGRDVNQTALHTWREQTSRAHERERHIEKIPLRFSQVQGARLLASCDLGWQDVCIIASSSRRRWNYGHTAADRPIASLRIVALRETSSDRARSWIVLETRVAQPLFYSSALHSTFSLGHSRVVILHVFSHECAKFFIISI